MKIFFDLDNVLAETEKSIIRKYNRDYDDTVLDWHSWDLTQCVRPQCGVRVYDYYSAEDCYYDVQPMEYSVYLTRRLVEHNHDVRILTSSFQEDGARAWAAMYFPYLPFIHTITKHTYSGADILVDDKPANLVHPHQWKYPILYSRMHNRMSTLYRVRDMYHLEEVLFGQAQREVG